MILRSSNFKAFEIWLTRPTGHSDTADKLPLPRLKHDVLEPAEVAVETIRKLGRLRPALHKVTNPCCSRAEEYKSYHYLSIPTNAFCPKTIMAEHFVYTFPSPLAGFEDAPPLPDEASEDGKSLKNPQTGVLSKAYEAFADPVEKGRRGGL